MKDGEEGNGRMDKAIARDGWECKGVMGWEQGMKEHDGWNDNGK